MSQFNINQRFEFLQDLTSMVVLGATPSLVVTGEGGLGKTHTVNQTIKSLEIPDTNWVSFKGYSTARGLYNTLFDHNGKLIIFDDCDSVLEDKVAQNILKSALDSYETRQISWMAKMNKSDEYPNQFNFTGRVIFISNKDKSKIDGAILSRSLTVDLSMTPQEKVDRMAFILETILPEFDLEVKSDALSFLDENKDKTNLNIRTLIIVSKIRKQFPDTWKNLAEYMINS
jgi:ABC-type dipeptide/oligopeptide/nickel transport system ATPase subunit